jgi:hypothetical protein
LRIDLICVEALLAIATAADADIEFRPSSGAERLSRSSRRLGSRVAQCITLHIDANAARERRREFASRMILTKPRSSRHSPPFKASANQTAEVSSSPQVALYRCSGKPRAWAGWTAGKSHPALAPAQRSERLRRRNVRHDIHALESLRGTSSARCYLT